MNTDIIHFRIRNCFFIQLPKDGVPLPIFYRFVLWLSVLICQSNTIKSIVQKYADVSNTRLASGNISIACSRNSTPVILGILWSTKSNASDSFRSFNCSRISKAVRPEPARSTLNPLPYLFRKSRSTDFKTCGSSSTVRITGFVLLPSIMMSTTYLHLCADTV